MAYVVQVSAKLEIGRKPDRTTYTVGESLDLSGGTLLRSYREIYSDGTYRDVFLDAVDMDNISYWNDRIYMDDTGFNSNAAGKYRISFEFTRSGSSDRAELEVEVLEPITTTTTTTTTVTTTTTTTATHVQSVSAALSVGRLPHKTTYTVGEGLDLGGGTLIRSYREFYNDGSYRDIYLDELDMKNISYWNDRVYTDMSDYNREEAGEYTIGFDYTRGGSTAHAELKVRVEATQTTTTPTTTVTTTTTSAKADQPYIRIVSMPNRTDYELYQYYDLAGGTVEIGILTPEGPKNSEIIPMNDPRITKTTNYQGWRQGRYTMTFSYSRGGATAVTELELTVGMTVTTTVTTTTETTTSTTTTTSDKRYTAELEIVRLPYQLSYIVGEALQLSGLTVNTYHVYEDRKELIDIRDAVALHSDKYEVTGFDSDTPGEKELWIVYRSYNSDLGEWVYAYEPFNVTVNETTTATSTTTSATTTTTTTTVTETEPASTTTTTPAPYFILGDVNDDGYVNAVDASDILAEYASLSSGNPRRFTERQVMAADVDRNGVTDAVDASSVLAFYAYLSGGGGLADMRDWLKY